MQHRPPVGLWLLRAGVLGGGALVIIGAGTLSGRPTLALVGAALGLAICLGLRIR